MSDSPGRRRVLSALAAGAGATAAAAAAWPFAAAVVEPLAAPAPVAPWIDVAAASALGPAAPLKVPLRAPVRDGFFTQLVDLGAVFLLAGPPLVALSAVCPHLGCGVSATPAGFLCPCHDSRFDRGGAALSGPSPRALDPLPVRVVRGRVEVQAVRFASGLRERRAL